MKKISNIIIIFALLLALVNIGLAIFNRPLFCKITMINGIGSVPAMCLEDALDRLQN